MSRNNKAVLDLFLRAGNYADGERERTYETGISDNIYSYETIIKVKLADFLIVYANIQCFETEPITIREKLYDRL